MAKKNGKPAKDKKKAPKKPAAKLTVKKGAKATPKKPVVKLVKAAKPVVTKKTVVKPAAKASPAKASPAKAPLPKALSPKTEPATGKGLLKAIGNAVTAVAKKAIEKNPEKPAKSAKVRKPLATAKVGKVDGKAENKADSKVAAKPASAEEVEFDGNAGDEELVDEEVVLTDAEGRRYCRVKDCDQLSAVDGYCRYHYLALWKKIQVRKKILSEGKLERYIEELTARYPDKFLEMLRKDLRSEKEFLAAIQELEIDENAVDNEFEDEAQNYIDEVRGMEPAARDDEDF